MIFRPVRLFAGVMIASVLLVSPRASANWPGWRGPEGTGASPAGSPPTTWSETQNVKWKVPLPGSGQSTPIVWGEKIFLLSASDAGGGTWSFDVVCFNRADGKILWQQTAAKEVPQEGHHPTGSFAAYSAVTDGQFVWASFGSRGLHCYDVNGKHVWSKPLEKMTIKRGFGEGSSPLLVDNSIVVLQDHEGSSRIAAYDKATGDLIWEKSRDEKTTWSSPMAVKAGEKTQIVTNASNKIRSYDLATGELLWECGGMTANVIPTPAFGNSMVYCASGFRGSALAAIKLDHAGDVTGTDGVAWVYSGGTPYVSSPLLYGDRLYFLNTNTASLTCIDAKTGAAKFEHAPLEGLGTVYASPMGAGGHVYITDRDGKTAVVEQSDSFKPVSVNVLDDGFDATPVAVGDEIFLRGTKYLYCIAGS